MPNEIAEQMAIAADELGANPNGQGAQPSRDAVMDEMDFDPNGLLSNPVAMDVDTAKMDSGSNGNDIQIPTDEEEALLSSQQEEASTPKENSLEQVKSATNSTSPEVSAKARPNG